MLLVFKIDPHTNSAILLPLHVSTIEPSTETKGDQAGNCSTDSDSSRKGVTVDQVCGFSRIRCED
jgi:hypothetical protein